MAGVIVGLGGPTDSARIELATKKGRPIRNARRQERRPEILREAERISLSHGPSVRTRSLTGTYNCYGMVFAARRTWVHEEDVAMIFQDDEYRAVPDVSSLQVGDLVVYRKDRESDITHVGIAVAKEKVIEQAKWKVTILSQWGDMGEYFHLENEVNPLLGDHREYYTERRPV